MNNKTFDQYTESIFLNYVNYSLRDNPQNLYKIFEGIGELINADVDLLILQSKLLLIYIKTTDC